MLYVIKFLCGSVETHTRVSMWRPGEEFKRPHHSLRYSLDTGSLPEPEATLAGSSGRDWGPSNLLFLFATPNHQRAGVAGAGDHPHSAVYVGSAVLIQVLTCAHAVRTLTHCVISPAHQSIFKRYSASRLSARTTHGTLMSPARLFEAVEVTALNPRLVTIFFMGRSYSSLLT